MAQKVTPIREQTRAVVRSLLARTALELFAAKGYDNTTVEEVAAAAGVSRRTLFNYFRNKEDLALSGLSEQGELIAARLAERPAEEDVWTSLRAAFQVLEEIDMTAEAPARDRHAPVRQRVPARRTRREAGALARPARTADRAATARLRPPRPRGTRDRGRGDHLPAGSERGVGAPGRAGRPRSTSTTPPCRPSAAPSEAGRIQLHHATKPSYRTQRRPPEPLTRHISANVKAGLATR